MNILLIEPDRLLGSIYETALSRSGHKVTWCVAPQNAIHASEKQKPGLVITELQLPGHSGVEFLYEFRSYPEWQEIPVLLHTIVPWQALEGQGRHFKGLGIAKYLYKPTTSLEQLSHAIDELAPVQS